MNQQLPRTPLALDVVGQPVATLTALRRIANQLTAIQGIWFAVEPWPEDVAVIYVKPENAERLAEIVRETTDPMTRQLEAKLRSQAKAAFHDEGTLEIDDEAPVSLSEENRGKGAYVQAWVWVRKDGDHTCTACEAEWFGFELRPEPSTPQQPATGEACPSGYCPACGAPCYPKNG